MNPNEKGRNTEALVLTYILGLGYSVSIPFGDKDRYDQIWDIDGKLLRVQVKTSRLKKEKNPENVSICFNCKSSINGKTRKYSENEIDYFATYWDGRVYLVPVTECSAEKTLRFVSSQSYQPNICWAKDYEVEEVIKRL